MKHQFDELKLSRFETLQRIEQYKNQNKSKYFKPFWYQQKILDFLRIGKKTVIFQGANQTGKTILASNIVDSFVNGKERWNEDKISLFEGRPTSGRIICAEWEHHANEVIVPKLKEWVTAGTYVTKKNNVGVEAFWFFENGSRIELLTHVQETKAHEGWTGDWVWFDEPMPQDKYSANARGLVARNGVMIITMTALTESWIQDELILKTDPSIGVVKDIPIYENKTLTKEAIEHFAKTCTDDERIARIEGKSLQLAGQILPIFDQDKHIIKPFKIPPDWPVVPMIDWHLSLPIAIGFYTMDKMGRTYAIDEVWENLTPEQVSDEIIKRKNAMQTCWNIKHVFIDPLSKGDSEYMKNKFTYHVKDAYTTIEDKLRRYGIVLHVASKNKTFGIQNIKESLKGANGLPTLFFFNNLKRHFYEIQRWRFDKNGIPLKENDHFMENLYRFTLTGTQYIPENLYKKKLDIPQMNIA